MDPGLAGHAPFENDHSLAGAAAVDDTVGAPGAPGAGESWTGAAGVRFGAGGGFLAATPAGDGAAVGAAAAGAAAAAGRGAAAPLAAGADRIAGALVGSGVMMFTAGVLAALGNSALVGLPVGTDGGSPASSPEDVAARGGAFHDGA